MTRRILDLILRTDRRAGNGRFGNDLFETGKIVAGALEMRRTAGEALDGDEIFATGPLMIFPVGWIRITFA